MVQEMEEKDIDLEALQVELEYVDTNLNHQVNIRWVILFRKSIQVTYVRAGPHAQFSCT